MDMAVPHEERPDCRREKDELREEQQALWDRSKSIVGWRVFMLMVSITTIIVGGAMGLAWLQATAAASIAESTRTEAQSTAMRSQKEVGTVSADVRVLAGKVDNLCAAMTAHITSETPGIKEMQTKLDALDKRLQRLEILLDAKLKGQT